MRINNLGSHLAHRKLVYLDTNAWSDLAKGAIDPLPLKSWLQSSDSLLWFSRFQIAELSRSEAVVQRLPSLLTQLDPWLLDLHSYDLSGGHWTDAAILPLAPAKWMVSSPDTFRNEFMQSGMARARADLLAHGNEMGSFIVAAQDNMRRDGWPTWRDFPERNAKWVERTLTQNGIAFDPAMLRERTRFIGLKLAHAVVFHRHAINKSAWKASDYVDYLHASDMAYAGIVVTERNLAECIRHATEKLNLEGPRKVFNISWLHDNCTIRH